MLMCCFGKGGMIYMDDEYEDFVVWFEFKFFEGGNNGFVICYLGSGDIVYVGMCEL